MTTAHEWISSHIPELAKPVSPDVKVEAGLDFRIHPMRAARAMRKLIANKEDTHQVFEIMRALRGRSLPNGLARLLETPGGGEIAWRRQELVAILSDTGYLQSLPEGSVGHAYHQFTSRENISAQGLIDDSMKGQPEIQSEHPIAWYARRLRDVHDIWHILTGYGRDALGEACVVAFSYAQTRSFGFAFIAMVGGLKIQRELRGRPVLRAVFEAYMNGRKARWLPAEDYVRLMAEPLDAARRRLGINAPGHYLAIPASERNGSLAPQMAA